jgi:cellulose synthase/poly-beta-1,6-N-acetylglucosamine synthase-like glycosyltransferase
MPLLLWHDLLLYIPLTVFRVLVLGYAAVEIARHAGARSDWLGLVLGGVLLAPSLFDLAAWFSLPVAQRPSRTVPPQGLRVAAVTTFVPSSESLEMLERTVRDIAAMNYPHDTWILDEGLTAEVRSLCNQYGIRYFSRNGRPEYNQAEGTFKERSKHGNYNAWLQETGFASYDIIAAFDPDHVPDRDFLMETLGYFGDPAVGYVQAAQAYYNQEASFIAAGAAEETYAYHSAVQMACWRSGYPVIVGCHNVHRMSALREAGGFAAHEADDLLLSIQYRVLGWQGVYVPAILARGLAPVDWPCYLGQQIRWARAVLDLKLRRPQAARRAGLATRVLSILQGARYLTDAAFAIAVTSTIAALLITGTVARFVPLLLLAVLPAIVGTLCNRFKTRFYLDSEGESGWPWRSYVLRTAKWPYTLAAAASVMINRHAPYIVTPKSGKRQGGPSVTVPQLILAGVFAAAWATGALRGAIHSWPFHVLGAMAVAIPLSLAATARLKYPVPFDASLPVASKISAPARRPLDDLAGAIVTLFAFLWSLPGLQHGTISYTDSARHAMNGVCILDLFRTFSVARPVQFATDYFNRLPALTMPYHPPLYPAFEAIVFAILGVNFGAARLALALAVSLAIYLMFRFGLLLLESAIAAAACCAALLSLPSSQWLARNVMLEFPAMAFAMAAAICLLNHRDGFKSASGIQYGLLVACGIWTKQTVFLGLLPFVYFVLTRNGKAFKQSGVWLATGISGMSLGALFVLGRLAGWSGFPHNWEPHSFLGGLLINLKGYGPTLIAGGVAVSLVLVALRTQWLSSRFRAVSLLLIAWLLSAAVVVLAVPAYDSRYLFSALPPMLFMICAVWIEAGAAFGWRFAAEAILVAAALISFAWNGVFPAPYLSGPELVAGALREAGWKRVLFFGQTDGSFTFAVRQVNSQLDSVVIRGDLLPPRFWSPEGVTEAAKMFGIEAIVVEEAGSGQWSYLRTYPPKSTQLWREFRQDSSSPRFRGHLLVYRVETPTAPSGIYRQSSNVLGSVAAVR